MGVTDNRAYAQEVADLGVPSDPFQALDLQSNCENRVSLNSNLPNVNTDDSLERLEYAAEEGNEVAMWKLGRIYSSCEQDKQSHLRAFEMFSRVVRSQVDLTPYSSKAPFTANAFVSLGQYYRSGIPDSPIQKNEDKAWGMFLTAATYYGDPNAQYALFEMCDAAALEKCSNVQAGRWLKKSALNGDVNGQARFGYRQFEGIKGLKQDRVEGLKWLTVARERAHPAHREWVQELHERAFSVADLQEREKAQKRARKWMKKYCKNNNSC